VVQWGGVGRAPVGWGEPKPATFWIEQLHILIRVGVTWVYTSTALSCVTVLPLLTCYGYARCHWGNPDEEYTGTVCTIFTKRAVEKLK
jgi:hypothetical protein